MASARHWRAASARYFAAGVEVFKEASKRHQKMEINTDPTGARDAARAGGHGYEFGPYHLEPSTRRLLRNGIPVPLTPKGFDTLLALVERRDRVVEKSELMKLVWADSFVEEANLSQTIFMLRKTLGEAPDGRAFIDTVPRRGYRFAAGVREHVASPAASATHTGRWRWRVIPLTAAVAVVMVLAAAAVWMRRSGDAPRIESLVVLPFADLSDEGRPDSLAEGMADSLITKLGQIGSLRVISRTSAISYKGTTKTVPQIARELNVDGVVEGTVQRLSGRVRLNLTLIHAPTDRTIWAETYDADVQNAIGLHNEIARAIAGRTSVTLTHEEQTRLAATTRVNPQAYEAYLRGRHFWNRRSEPDMRQAIQQFEDALRHDRGYAAAYAGLADSYALYGSYGWTLPSGQAWSRAIEAAEKALQLDPLLADGHTSRARIALNYELDWERTERGYRRAIELNPGYANAHHWYGYYLMLTGRLTEGESELRRALALDPLSPIINANVGMASYFGRQYDRAIAHWRTALEMHRNYRLLHSYIAAAYLVKGQYQDAIAELQKSVDLAGAGVWERAMFAYSYAKMGRTHEARTLLSDLGPAGDADAYHRALAYVGVGETDRVFMLLEKAVDSRLGAFNEVNVDPIFDPLRADPRFAALLRRMRFPGDRQN
jgi:TolB-like protein/DNA-binding winged helix-turn-helix (wHTH) protein/Tfp pilus assembly protein PilF